MQDHRILLSVKLGIGLGLIWGLFLIAGMTYQPWNVGYETWFWESFRMAFVYTISALLVCGGLKILYSVLKRISEVENREEDE